MLSGIATGISWMLLYEAYAQVGVGVATLAYYCGPMIVMILSPLLLRETMSVYKAVSFLVVLTGMVLVTGAAFRQGGFSHGLLLSILAAFLYAVMIFFNKNATRITGLENPLIQLLMSFFTVSLYVLIKRGLPWASMMRNILPALLLGVVNTGIGCYLYFSSIQKLPAGSVAICGYLEPLSAVLFSTLLLQEKLASPQILGALIIGGAVAGELAARKIR